MLRLQSDTQSKPKRKAKQVSATIIPKELEGGTPTYLLRRPRRRFRDHAELVGNDVMLFGRPRKRPYVVTYTLNPRGKFVAEREPTPTGKDFIFIKPADGKIERACCVCFLPLVWDGKRVTRHARTI